MRMLKIGALRRPHQICLLLAVLLLVLPMVPSTSSSSTQQQQEHQRDLGGADATKSAFQRSVSGFTEALRYMAKALGEKEKQRTPKQVRLALVGFGRTGTTSMVSALHLLGYNFIHDDTLGEVSDLHARLAAKDDPFSIDDFVQECGNRGFDAIFFFSDEFLEWAAKTDKVHVILTKRDNGRKWAESWASIACMVDYLESRPFIWIQKVRELLPGYFQLIYKHISTQGQPDKYKDLDTLEAAYDAHLVKVRNMIPPNRLLEFNVKEGWEPLCSFLGKPVPQDTKFPHVNDRVVVRTLVATFWLVTWIWPFVPLLAAYLLWRLVVRLLMAGTDGGILGPSTTEPAKEKQN